jgi:hypothetical protein
MVTIILRSEPPTKAVFWMCQKKAAYLCSDTEGFQSNSERRLKTDYLGSYTDSFHTSRSFAYQQNFHMEQFHSHWIRSIFGHFLSDRETGKNGSSVSKILFDFVVRIL